MISVCGLAIRRSEMPDAMPLGVCDCQRPCKEWSCLDPGLASASDSADGLRLRAEAEGGRESSVSTANWLGLNSSMNPTSSHLFFAQDSPGEREEGRKGATNIRS